MLANASCEEEAVSVVGGTEQRTVAPALPSSIWVVAWAALAGQALLLARQGVRIDDAVSLGGSVVLGALLVGWVSAGVIRARTVRLLIVWSVLVLVLVLQLVDLGSGAQGPAELVSLATTTVTLAGLARYHRTEWFAWQRTKPSRHDGAPIGQLVAIGVLVGVLGGLTAPVDDGLDLRVSINGG